MSDRFQPIRLSRACWALVLAGVFAACGGDSPGFLVVVDSALSEPLEASLEVYAASLEAEGVDVYVEPWDSGTVDDLKALLFENVDRHGIEGALLIGDLPVEWFEGFFYAQHERFPTDLYLQDRDAIWRDRDGNGTFDYHSDLSVDIYTSRLIGTPTQLQDYFARAEHYRHVGSLVDPSAFIFLDDDWSEKNTSDLFQLGELYRTVEVIQDTADSTRSNYIEKLTGDGAEFVYQWIHGAPPGSRYSGWLQFDDPPKEDPTKIALFASDLSDFKVSFVNMANCFSARFTDPVPSSTEREPSIAEVFTVGTDYGLAVVGSTKSGAQTAPRLFHRKLAEGMTWGQAYRIWFNEEGNQKYGWNLGIVLMGDPLLTVRGDVAPSR